MSLGCRRCSSARRTIVRSRRPLPLRTASWKAAKASSGGGTPGDLAKNRFNDTRTSLGLCDSQRRFTAQFRQFLAQPPIRLAGISEGLFRQRLNADEPDGPVGFLYCQWLVFLGSMPSSTLRNHEALNLLLAEASQGQALQRCKRESTPHH